MERVDLEKMLDVFQKEELEIYDLMDNDKELPKQEILLNVGNKSIEIDYNADSFDKFTYIIINTTVLSEGSEEFSNLIKSDNHIEDLKQFKDHLENVKVSDPKTQIVNISFKNYVISIPLNEFEYEMILDYVKRDIEYYQELKTILKG